MNPGDDGHETRRATPEEQATSQPPDSAGSRTTAESTGELGSEGGSYGELTQAARAAAESGGVGPSDERLMGRTMRTLVGAAVALVIGIAALWFGIAFVAC